MRAVTLAGALLVWSGCASEERRAAQEPRPQTPPRASAQDEAEELAEGAAERATQSQSRIFRGRGSDSLGDLDLPTKSRLDWSGEAPLRLSIRHPRRELRSRSKGRLELSAGTHRGVEVRGRGRWIVRVVPVAEEEHEEHGE